MTDALAELVRFDTVAGEDVSLEKTRSSPVSRRPFLAYRDVFTACPGKRYPAWLRHRAGFWKISNRLLQPVRQLRPYFLHFAAH